MLLDCLEYPRHTSFVLAASRHLIRDPLLHSVRWPTFPGLSANAKTMRLLIRTRCSPSCNATRTLGPCHRSARGRRFPPGCPPSMVNLRTHQTSIPLEDGINSMRTPTAQTTVVSTARLIQTGRCFSSCCAILTTFTAALRQKPAKEDCLC